MTSPHLLVADHQFILATRDTGYRSLASAVAELIDNAAQAQAAEISVFVREEGSAGRDREVTVAVLDNGQGMDHDSLWTALQFGGTERFDDRAGLGRFGMGLPNSSVSQSRRFDVYSWREPGHILFSYLDVDEVADRSLREVPAPVRRALPDWAQSVAQRTGTLVVWPKCDRLDHRKASTIAEKLRKPLGRMYRHLLWTGTKISINGESIDPVDPLCCHPTTGKGGARQFGNALIYEIAAPRGGTSSVQIRFTELPVAEWSRLSIEEKRQRGVIGAAGVSFIRAGREIDYGWHLMGSKRKENYDDWWRCEVSFQPALDELFGVTHSKQGVTPTPYLQTILAPDLSAVARTLNARVRSAFEATKVAASTPAAQLATQQDSLLPVVASRRAARAGARWGLSYLVQTDQLGGREFFQSDEADGTLTLTINTDHPFYDKLYAPTLDERGGNARFLLECLLLAAARAELEAPSRAVRVWTRKLRTAWGDALAAFLDGRKA